MVGQTATPCPNKTKKKKQWKEGLGDVAQQKSGRLARARPSVQSLVLNNISPDPQSSKQKPPNPDNKTKSTFRYCLSYVWIWKWWEELGTGEGRGGAGRVESGTVIGDRVRSVQGELGWCGAVWCGHWPLFPVSGSRERAFRLENSKRKRCFESALR